MSALALELDDRALSLARSGQLLVTAPGAAFVGPSPGRGLQPWRSVRAQPTNTSTRHLGAVLSGLVGADREASLVREGLRRLIPEQSLLAGERIWIAAPARAEARGLAAVFAIAQQLSLPVAGFVDAATASVAALGPPLPAIVLELGLHHAAATVIDVESGYARRRRAVKSEAGGLIELYQAWLGLISATMVRRTRFDPLHDAAIEQALFDVLPELAREAVKTGGATAQVVKGVERFQVELTRDQFVSAAEPIARRVAGLLHGLRPAGASLAIAVPAAVADLPGLREALDQFTGCELIRLAEGFAATAVSRLELPAGEPDRESVRLIRRLPLLPGIETAPPISREMLGRRPAGGQGPPSHVLFGGKAFSLETLPLIVGRTSTVADTQQRHAAAASISLPDGLAGVSRRHCTLARDNGEVVLLDHSTFGTFVNGERVAERVRLRAGDRVRLGDPGVEIEVIAVSDATATA
ncbi:MAG TPA: FHA domain-containing protein [Steroidobacteraceae bacterium]|nr:FHA domain-containing protein [Steroidobacteraceae bacterium]